MDAGEVRRAWEQRSGEFSPRYYAYHGPDETSERIRAAIEAREGPAPSVLELGCSAGRHLAHLHRHGYGDVTGVDLNPVAFEVMAETYPELADAGTFHVGAIEDLVDGWEPGAFDVVFSVETLQHIHPDHDWVFEAVADLVADLLVTVEVEGDAATGRPGPPDVAYVDDDTPLYYRDWGRVFAEVGLESVETERLGRDTLRVFRTSGA